MFFFNSDRSKVNAESYIADAINNLSTTLRALIDQKSDKGHKHTASDIVSGVLDVLSIPDLDADKIASGVLDVLRIPDLSASKITSGAIGIARGGTGASTAESARANLAVTKRRNITANYSGTTTNNPDVLVKTFTATPTASGNTDIDISVSGYTPISISSFAHKPTANDEQIASAQFTYKIVTLDGTTNGCRARISTYVWRTWPTHGVTCTFDVTYIRTSIINQ